MVEVQRVDLCQVDLQGNYAPQINYNSTCFTVYRWEPEIN